ncbi:unnamed protein product [Toxocara canis]|uniref:Lipoprotein n=1 Tax=Toxocara canis TaxID=6265 RepID=A0A183V346_TOXCA|nr:unnamed protein product [Toxocara canis]
MIQKLVVLSIFVQLSYCASCGSAGIPFRFEVLPEGQPVLGCALPTCFGTESGGRFASQDSLFNMGPEGVDGFFREGDIQQERIRYEDAPPHLADCQTGFTSRTCNAANSWIGGFTWYSDGSIGLQCCTYDGLRFSTEVGRLLVKAGEVYSGGEVIRDGRQTGFDLIGNLKQITTNDGTIAYEVTVRRMSCIPDPVEISNSVAMDPPTDINRILDKVSEAQTNIGSQSDQVLSTNPAQAPRIDQMVQLLPLFCSNSFL